jgi:excisionase family DNA binding protein
MPTPRFLTLDDVAEILNVSWSQAYALVRRKELIAIQIGGRGAWRVEVAELERFIQDRYAEARGATLPPEVGEPEKSAEERAEDDTPGPEDDGAPPTPTQPAPAPTAGGTTRRRRRT